MSKYGVLFDLDGTVVDSLPDIAGILNVTRESYGLAPMPMDVTRRFIGHGIEHLVGLAIPEIGPEEVAEAIRRYRSYYMVNPHAGGALYPGARETLERFKHELGYRVGIATNKMTKVAERTIAHYLPDFAFDVVMGADRARERKPSPLHVLDALQAVGVNPANAVFVGDDPVDLQSAAGARVKFYAAGYGFGGVKAAPDDTLLNFSEIYGKVTQYFAAEAAT